MQRAVPWHNRNIEYSHDEPSDQPASKTRRTAAWLLPQDPPTLKVRDFVSPLPGTFAHWV